MLISPNEGLHASPSNRLKTVMQNESAECGLACLAMIATAFGHGCTLAELRRRFSVSSKGMNLRALMATADALGLAARPVRLELDEMRELKVPAILHWNLNHYVVLEKVRRLEFLVHDPAMGKRWLDRSEASRSFTGVAIEFTATHSFEPKQEVRAPRLADLFGRVRGLVPSLIQMVVLAVLMQAFALALPILNQIVIDEAITKGDLGLLKILAVAMGMLLATTTTIKVLQGHIGLYMGTQMSFQMNTNLLRHTLRLPVSWFEKRHVGDILSRFGSLQPVQDVVLQTIPATILNIVVGIVASTMMIIYSPLLAALGFLAVLITILIRAVTFPYVKRMVQEGLHLDAKVNTTFLETIRGARTFKLFAHERERVALWQNEQARLINNQVSNARFSLNSDAGSSILAGLQQILIWYIGARMVINGEMTLGMLFAFQAYTSQFGTATSVLIAEFFRYRTMRVHLERLADIVHTESEVGLDTLPSTDKPLAGRVELRNVSFRYADHEPPVLDNVSLEIEAGTFVCFQGPSGQGKTTLLKLLLGFEEAQQGEILLDDIPLRKYGISRFRSQIGVVLQDDQLFAGSIADNISFFDVDASQETIEQAATAARVHDDIAKLPMGYQTFVGDLGSSLSAGQRQRMLLARALYRAPKMIFLDEGTANLDPASEEAVMDTIRSLDVTRIVVAHRPMAAEGASKIMHVANGTVRNVQQNGIED